MSTTWSKDELRKIAETDDLDMNGRIDEAYRSKYKDSPYLEPMIGERARTATVRLVPTTDL